MECLGKFGITLDRQRTVCYTSTRYMAAYGQTFDGMVAEHTGMVTRYSGVPMIPAQTPLLEQLSVVHKCSHKCQVLHEFGNLFKCLSSGQLHVCDANCNKRVYCDPYSTICPVSRRTFPTFFVRENRKRGSSDQVIEVTAKRQSSCNFWEESSQVSMDVY